MLGSKTQEDQLQLKKVPKLVRMMTNEINVSARSKKPVSRRNEEVCCVSMTHSWLLHTSKYTFMALEAWEKASIDVNSQGPVCSSVSRF